MLYEYLVKRAEFRDYDKFKKLLYEANKEPMLDGVHPLDRDRVREPIYGDNKQLVGFFTPGKWKGLPHTGSTYVTPEHRRKGYATKAVKEFQKKNPGMLWFVKKTNAPSIGLAKKLGLIEKENSFLRKDSIMLAPAEKKAEEEYLYHGSPTKMKILEPKNLHGDPDVKEVIFATKYPQMAAAYLGKKWGDKDLNQSGYTTKSTGKNVFRLEEMRKGAFKDLFEGQKGYLYKVLAKDFENRNTLGNRTGSNWEVVSSKKIKPLERTEVKDALQYIKDQGVELTEFNPKGKTYLAAVERMQKRISKMDDNGRKQYVKWVRSSNPELAKAIVKRAAVKGIADRKDFGDLDELKPGKMVSYFLQKHTADRAGVHDDLRLGDASQGLHSWAVPKGLPEPSSKHLAVRQPIHDFSYGPFSGELKEGYGKGLVELVRSGKALITHRTPDRIDFTIADKQKPERYKLIHTQEKNWIIMRDKHPVKPEVRKPKFKLVDESKLTKLKPDSIAQPKLDGAYSIISLDNGRGEIFSDRTSKKDDSAIVYTEKVMKRKFVIPKGLKENLLGEVYGVRDGKAIHPSELSGILNSNIDNAIATQKTKGIELKTMVFDIVSDKPYKDRYGRLKDIVTKLRNPKIELVPNYDIPSAELIKMRMLKHHLTNEGLIIREGERGSKLKLRSELNVLIDKMFPGKGKYEGKGVGGFMYKTDKGTVGKVGTGFTDEVRKDMHKNPEKYIGRVARITSQEVGRSGLHRGPSYIALDESK